jgi:hypothetical protein
MRGSWTWFYGAPLTVFALLDGVVEAAGLTLFAGFLTGEEVIVLHGVGERNCFEI